MNSSRQLQKTKILKTQKAEKVMESRTSLLKNSNHCLIACRSCCSARCEFQDNHYHFYFRNLHRPWGGVLFFLTSSLNKCSEQNSCIV